jgi:hypothetical protein
MSPISATSQLAAHSPARHAANSISGRLEMRGFAMLLLHWQSRRVLAVALVNVTKQFLINASEALCLIGTRMVRRVREQ